MKHDCTTDHQGRVPCTCGQLHTANSDGTSPEQDPWAWVDQIAIKYHAAAAIVALLFFVLAAAGYFSTERPS